MRKNTILLIIYEIAVYLAPLITAPYVARVLGANGTGVYSYTHSIASYFILFIQLGVSLYGRREIASMKDKKQVSNTFWEIFTVTSIMFILVSLAYFTTTQIIFNDYKIEFIFQFMLLISAWLDISWLFFGLEKFKIAISRNLIVKLLSLILVFIFVRTPDDTLKYIGLLAASNLASILVVWITLPKYILKPKIQKRTIMKHLKGMSLLFLPILAIQLYSITDKVCIGIISNMSEVGIYENVYKISRVPVAVITAIGTVMLPRITKMISEGKAAKTKQYINKSLSITLIIGIGCAFGMFATSKVFVNLYLGEEFSSGVNVLQILSLVLIALSWGNVFRMQYILPNKLDKLYLKSVVIGAVINIALNILLIPHYAGFGAAIASLISELTICIYQTICIKKEFDMKKLLKNNLKYLLSGAIMCVIVMTIGEIMNINQILLITIQIIIGTLSYFIIIILLERKSDNQIFINELRRIKRRLIK